MTVAAIATPQGGCLTFINETFTGGLTSVISAALPVASSYRMLVRSWSLTVTGNTAVCPVQLKGSTTGIYAATRIPLVAVGETGETFTNPCGFPGFYLVAGEELVIDGGGTGGVLDGVIYYDLIPVAV